MHRGIVPAVAGRGGVPELLIDSRSLDHAAEGAAGALTILGVKYTTARRVAEQVTNLVRDGWETRCDRRERRRRCCPAPASPITRRWRSRPRARSASNLPIATIRHLIALYAERAADIDRLMHDMPDLPSAAGAVDADTSARKSSTSSGTRWRSG